jgi:hypothetical protein
MFNKFLQWCNNNRKIVSILISSLLAAIIGFSFRVIFLYFNNIDLLAIIDNPGLTFFVLFNLNLIRYAIRYYLEEIIWSGKPLMMNIDDLLNPERGRGNTSKSKISVDQLLNPGFKIVDGVYKIDDPTNMLKRGYLDPMTDRAYIYSSQPFLKNLADAMEHEAKSRNLESAKFNTDKFDEETQKFWRNWMTFNHYNLNHSGPWNCAWLRNQMRAHR